MSCTETWSRWVVAMMAVVVTGIVPSGPRGEASTTAAARWTPPDGTITRVVGSRTGGFRVEYLHRRTDFLPTLSEVLAECQAYPKPRRARCEARTRARYFSLAQMRDAIRYARGS